MRILIFFLFVSVLSHSDSTAQKFLIIERTGSIKTERIAVYDEITFQLKDDDKGWYTRQILDLNADAQMVMLGDLWVPLDDITRIHLKRKRVLASIIGGAMQGGGVTMIFGDIYYTVRGDPEYTQGGIEFGLLNILVGTGIKAVLGPIKYKLGKKTRLRVIDITFRSNDRT